jgi:CheY-like chemotaxis protein
MFEAFTQADGAYTRRYAGTGLGLGIVRRLVANMGGSLAVDSKVGRGTSVYFSLPFGRPGPSPHQAPRPPAAQEPGRSLHVLLVEDERVNQMAARVFLGKQGHSVRCADDGQQALEMLARERFDCVLMDVQMPGMDGLAATRAIRQSGLPFARVPIIAMTAHAMEGDRTHFLKQGMDGYIAKPVVMDDLESELARVTSRGRSRS